MISGRSQGSTPSGAKSVAFTKTCSPARQPSTYSHALLSTQRSLRFMRSSLLSCNPLSNSSSNRIVCLRLGHVWLKLRRIPGLPRCGFQNHACACLTSPLLLNEAHVSVVARTVHAKKSAHLVHGAVCACGPHHVPVTGRQRRTDASFLVHNSLLFSNSYARVWHAKQTQISHSVARCSSIGSFLTPKTHHLPHTYLRGFRPYLRLGQGAIINP